MKAWLHRLIVNLALIWLTFRNAILLVVALVAALLVIVLMFITRAIK